MIHRNLTIALATAGIYVGGAFALKAAEKAGVLAPGIGSRALLVFSGLTLAVYANFLPKTLGKLRDPGSAMRMDSVLRVSGWAYMLGGLGFAVAALLPVSDVVPMTLLGTASAYAVGYAAWAFMEPGQGRCTRT